MHSYSRLSWPLDGKYAAFGLRAGEPARRRAQAALLELRDRSNCSFARFYADLDADSAGSNGRSGKPPSSGFRWLAMGGSADEVDWSGRPASVA